MLCKLFWVKLYVCFWSVSNANPNFLTTLDLCKGYWQVPLTESSKDLHSEYQVDCLDSQWCLLACMEHWLHSKGWWIEFWGVQNNMQLHTLMILLSSCWCFSTHQKCRTCHKYKEISHLQARGAVPGYVIGGGGIRPQVAKVDQVTAAPFPNTKKRLQSFLGLVSWYCQLIPNFSSRVVLLTNMKRKSSSIKIEGIKEAENAFNDLKDCVWNLSCSVQILDFPLQYKQMPLRWV